MSMTDQEVQSPVSIFDGLFDIFDAVPVLNDVLNEKPRYNIAHSVASPPNVIGPAKPQARYTPSDASRFPAPDAIASDEPKAEHEARLDELEKLAARQLIPRTPCPTCDYILLTREYDGLIKCLNCLGMWAPEELPADFEAFLQQLEETR